MVRDEDNRKDWTFAQNSKRGKHDWLSKQWNKQLNRQTRLNKRKMIKEQRNAESSERTEDGEKWL